MKKLFRKNPKQDPTIEIINGLIITISILLIILLALGYYTLIYSK